MPWRAQADALLPVMEMEDPRCVGVLDHLPELTQWPLLFRLPALPRKSLLAYFDDGEMNRARHRNIRGGGLWAAQRDDGVSTKIR